MSDKSVNSPMRMHIALKILRAWNHGTAGYDAHVVRTINRWIDGGMDGPVPWTDCPFFEEWATEHGYSRIGEYVGFKMLGEITEGETSA